MKKIIWFLVATLLVVVPTQTFAAPFVKDSFIATDNSATSSFAGNFSVAGHVQLGLSTGLLSIVNGLVSTVTVQAPLSFMGNTLSLSAAGSDGEIQFNDGGNLGSDPSFIYDKEGKVLNVDAEDQEFVVQGKEAVTQDSWGTGISLQAGQGLESGRGGGIYVMAGQAGDTGDGGEVVIRAGTAGGSSGAGGTITLTAGNAQEEGSPEGNILFEVGSQEGSGVGGNVIFARRDGSHRSIFNFDAVASDKIFTFPNFTGTFGLLEANQTWSGENSFSFGASATTTVNFGEMGDSSSRSCFNTKNTDGDDISFYFEGTTIVVENNTCK